MNYLPDISIESPDTQFGALVSLIEADDASHPAPLTRTPPRGEAISQGEYLSENILESAYLPPADFSPYEEAEVVHAIADAPGSNFPAPTWENDDQYHGLGVPPGVPNWGQPIESGHTQVTVPNPSDELGWDAWSGRPAVARVARMQNNFPGYNAGTSRGHMLPIEKLQYRGPADYFTQQGRDLLLSEVLKRGVHNIVVADVPSESYTEQVAWIDPTTVTETPIGEEGLLP